MIHVILADPYITVHGWLPAMDFLGAYELKIHKLQSEITAEKRLTPGRRISPYRYESMTVLSRSESEPDVVRFLPGLWPRVKTYLDSAKIKYTMEDKRNPDIRPKPDFTELKGIQFRPGQAEILATIIASDCGIIAASVGGGKSWLIAKLCRIYPTLNIVVTTNMISVTKQLYKDISAECPGEVGLITGSTDTSAGCRIVVSTINSLDKIPPDKVHLLLVDEAHCLGAEAYSRRVARFCFARRFGFTATPVRNDGTERVMESLVGPIIAKTTYQESVDNGVVTPVKYTMLPCNGCPEILYKPDLPNHIIERMAYYRNRTRNNIIRNMVYRLKTVYDGQILIVVGTTEHAIALHKMLPWFVVAHSESFDPNEFNTKFAREYPDIDCKQYILKTKDMERILAAFAKGTLKYLIATKIVKQGLNMPHLRCLIRADATKSEVDCFQIPGRLSRLDKGKSEAYLIDLYDGFIPRTQRKSEERRKAYNKHGWIEVTEDALINDIARTNTEGTAGTAQQCTAEPGSGQTAQPVE